MRVLIINGPNLNLVGTREPELYGHESLTRHLEELKQSSRDIELDIYQSNVEGEIINKLQAAESQFDGVILNAGGYSHTSVAIADAIAAVSVPVIEVHITNIYAREPERHHSLISKYAAGCIIGLGLEGYDLGLQSLRNLVHHQNEA